MNDHLFADDREDERARGLLATGGGIETHDRVTAVRDRLSVRQIAVGLQVARELASHDPAGDGHGRPQNGDQRSRAHPGADAPDAAVQTGRPREELPEQPDEPDRTRTTVHPGQWVPDHDDPVSLAGVAVPRTRTVRRSIATPDVRPRQPAGRGRGRDGSAGFTRADPAASALAARSPRLILVSACGGAGATTAAVLIAAALAPVTGVLLVAGGVDRAALTTSANAGRGDVDALATWLGAHRGGRLEPGTPGLARGDAGTGQLVVAAVGHDDPGHAFEAGTAIDLLAAATTTDAAVLLDWSSPELPPGRVWDSATHVIVTAPSTDPGLVAAECTVQSLHDVTPEDMPLSLITVDIRGRTRRRAGRASLARLSALRLPVTHLPYDPALAANPRVDWAALRPRTRTAVFAALADIQHPDQLRKDHR